MSVIVSSLGLAALAVIGASAATLGSYNVDPTSVSVSGMSSGGFFSVQLGVAYSSIFQTGFGVFAGGPFDCARNQLVSWLTPFIWSTWHRQSIPPIWLLTDFVTKFRKPCAWMMKSHLLPSRLSTWNSGVETKLTLSATF